MSHDGLLNPLFLSKQALRGSDRHHVAMAGTALGAGAPGLPLTAPAPSNQDPHRAWFSGLFGSALGQSLRRLNASPS